MKNKNASKFMPDELGIQYRTYEIELRADGDDDSREIELSFSSEAVIDRYYYREILDHGSEAVSLKRLRSGAPLLMDHDRKAVVGVIEKASIAEGVGRAIARFGKSALAEEIRQDVKDKIRKLVSVGYRIYEAVLEKTEKEGLDTYRVTKWEPQEISIVSVPADISVGIGRSDEKLNKVNIIKREVNIMTPEELAAQAAATEAARVAALPPAPVAPAPVAERVIITQDEKDRAVQAARDGETARVREINAIGQRFKMEAEAIQAIKGDTTVDAFRKAALEKLDTVGAIDTQQTDIGMTEREVKEYSFQRMLRSVLLKDASIAGLEWEASREVEKQSGNTPRSFFVPHDVLRGAMPQGLAQRVLTTASGGTGVIGTDLMPQNFIDLLRNRAAVMALGARVLSGLKGNADIPKQTGAATAYWLATETTDITLSDSAYGVLSLTPKNVGAATQFTRNMLLQSNPSIEGLVIDDLNSVLALAIDLAAIDGSGAAGQPTGVLNTSGIGAVTGTTLAWPGVVEFETDVAGANADIGNMGWLMPAAMRGLLKTREKSSGYPVFLADGNEANGYPIVVSNQVPAATILFGVWSQIIIAMWGGLDILVDEYAAAASGGIVIWAYQTLDIGVRQAGAFSAADTIT